jgi:hypothetical protein
MSKWPDPTPGICDNCGASLFGDYCHICGQHEKSYIRNVFSLFSEFMQEFSSWDSRVFRTLVPLMFRPGYLSREYVVGRRVRYVPPLRLYIFVSLMFFLALTFAARVDTSGWRQQLQEQEAAAAVAAAGSDPETRTPPPECDSTGIQYRSNVDGPLADRLCVTIPWLTEAANQRLKAQIIRVLESPDLALQQARQLAPPMMFLMLPVFALVLKLLYLFAGRYYTEHFTLALHTHSFLFLSFLLLMAASGISGIWTWAEKPVGLLSAALMVWMPVYLFLAQKFFYRQGIMLTTVKYFMTGFLYFFMMLFAAIALVLVSVISA